MNLILLPFFALVPIAKRYWEFLAFDILTAAIIVVGFSQPLQIVGITYSIDQFWYFSPVQWMAIIRSVWLGKFLLWDGLRKVIRGRIVAEGTLSAGIMKLDNWLRARLFRHARRMSMRITLVGRGNYSGNRPRTCRLMRQIEPCVGFIAPPPGRPPTRWAIGAVVRTGRSASDRLRSAM